MTENQPSPEIVDCEDNVTKRPLFWSRFLLDRYSKESAYVKLIPDSHVSSSIPAPCTRRDVIAEIARQAHVPIDSLADELGQPTFSRAQAIFGYAGDEIDQIVRNYPNMRWWVTNRGLVVAVLSPDEILGKPSLEAVRGLLLPIDHAQPAIGPEPQELSAPSQMVGTPLAEIKEDLELPPPPPDLMSASRYYLYAAKWVQARRLGRRYSWEQFDLEQAHERLMRELEEKVREANDGLDAPVRDLELTRGGRGRSPVPEQLAADGAGEKPDRPQTTSAAPPAIRRRPGRKRGAAVDDSKLKRYRGSLTQEEFADKCGISVATIQRGDAGERWSDKTFEAVALAIKLLTGNPIEPEDLKKPQN